MDNLLITGIVVSVFALGVYTMAWIRKPKKPRALGFDGWYSREAEREQAKRYNGMVNAPTEETWVGYESDALKLDLINWDREASINAPTRGHRGPTITLEDLKMPTEESNAPTRERRVTPIKGSNK